MLLTATFFFLAAIVFAVFGFSAIAGADTQVFGQVGFYVCLVLFLATLLMKETRNPHA